MPAVENLGKVVASLRAARKKHGEEKEVSVVVGFTANYAIFCPRGLAGEASQRRTG